MVFAMARAALQRTRLAMAGALMLLPVFGAVPFGATPALADDDDVPFEQRIIRSLLGGNSGFADQCALEFSQESLPPLFGMGSHDAEVGLWHWAAFRSRDLLGALDLIGTLPPEALPNPPAGLLRPSRAGDVAEGSGLGVLRTAGPGEVAVRPRHSAGAWELIFVAKLASAGFDPQTLVPGSGRSAQWNLAIWNGSAEDVGARKAISIWHELVLGDGRTDRR